MIGKQAWFHSWYADIVGLHLIPILFVFLAFFELPPFGTFDPAYAWVIVSWVLVFDWAHIFAQWHRIYSNPVESSKMKWIYPLSYVLLVPLITLILFLDTKFYLDTILVYFVIYHFIKQQFGFIRVYTKIDGPKQRLEGVCENSLIYLSMLTPLIYWHTSIPYDRFGWNNFFIKVPAIQNLFYPMLACYALSFIGYLYFEISRSRRNKNINLAKNFALIATILGWGVVSLLAESKFLIFFTVVLAHDASYIFFVWLIGRRDSKLSKGEISWTSWWSMPGFVFYVLFLIVISQLVLLVHHRLIGNAQLNVIFGAVFDTFQGGWALNLGFGLYFATQAHHYFIDRFLWKKEKDFEYLVKTGKVSLSSR